jgi:hypothetical protein
MPIRVVMRVKVKYLLYLYFYPWADSPRVRGPAEQGKIFHVTNLIIIMFVPIFFLYLTCYFFILISFAIFCLPLLCVATLHYRDKGAEAREQQKGIKIRKKVIKLRYYIIKQKNAIL